MWITLPLLNSKKCLTVLCICMKKSLGHFKTQSPDLDFWPSEYCLSFKLRFQTSAEIFKAPAERKEFPFSPVPLQ